ncbi:MAG: lytic transglycosylase domain-containing protein [Sulfurospirillaceae bacterium]|nr:lytic transglycosylase domain-containing protein [Sulfurospirillaceae bacterium]
MIIWLSLILPVLLFAKLPQDISFFDHVPKSIEKDYYIYRFLNERNVSSNDAEKLLSEAKVVNLKLFKSFAKRIDDSGFKKASKCLKLKTDALLATDSECIAIGLSVRDAMSLDKNKLRSLYKELKGYRDINETLKVLSSDDVFDESLKNKKDFIDIFNSCGAKNRSAVFDKPLSKEDIDELSHMTGFNRTIEIILTQRDLKNLQKSLLSVNINKKFDADSIFFLGLNALEFNQKNKAIHLFEKAYDKYYYRFDKDKTLFWRYLITKNDKYLDELLESFDVNIYTIYAREKKSEKFTNIISPQIKTAKANYDIQDPFLWLNLLREIKDKNTTQLDKLSSNFRHINTIGQYSFLQERAHGFEHSYFPMPFYNLLENYSKDRIALILALGRQESRFIPASISTSYALGMMQFMPFLAKAMAKKKKIKNFDLDDMFKPKIAYSFANTHLDYLSKYLHNPILIAYAYNGGIGFVRRLLKTGDFFTKSEYEPYLSMELIPYSESRRYGKKVLANYIIYSQLLGRSVSFKSLSQNLMTPKRRDEFEN